MEKHLIKIGHGGNEHTYEVRDYPHHEKDTCKFEVLLNDNIVLKLDPDGAFLRECANPGDLDDEEIHLIIERVEKLNI